MNVQNKISETPLDQAMWSSHYRREGLSEEENWEGQHASYGRKLEMLTESIMVLLAAGGKTGSLLER